MPRGRGRGRSRSRLSRMDAAVDAMVRLGFPEAKVKKQVKELLKVYGGNDGWPFIEEFAYKVLIDSILEAKDDEVLLLEDKQCDFDDEEAGGALDIIPSNVLETSGAAAAEPSRRRLPCYGWIDSDEDDLNDDDFIDSMPMPTATEEAGDQTLDLTIYGQNSPGHEDGI